jgi:hypothetical protein
MLNDGGVIDDLIVYFLSDTVLPHRRQCRHRRQGRRLDAATPGRHRHPAALTVRRDLAMIAVQGPNARAKTWAAIPGAEAASSALKPFQAATFGDFFIARTGYTGEDGFELTLPSEQAATPGMPSLRPASSPLRSRRPRHPAPRGRHGALRQRHGRIGLPPRRRPGLDGGSSRTKTVILSARLPSSPTAHASRCSA